MRKKMDKNLILNSFNIKFLYDKMFNKYKMLNKEEFDLLLEFITMYFYSNMFITEKFLNTSKGKKILEIAKKVNTIYKNNKTLYRGVSFRTKADLDDYLKSYVLEAEESVVTAWSTSKKISKQFIPGGKYSKSKKYGVLHSFKPKDHQIFFATHPLFPTYEDKVKFIKLVFKEEYKKHMKTGIKEYIHSKKGSLFKTQQGALYSILESEVLCVKVHMTDVKSEVMKG